MPKSFILADEQLNNYGFWLPMSGADLKQFKRNPIMLWMHSRAFSGRRDEVLPIGHWENIRIEGEQLLADPVFDQNDDFALQIESKVDAGIIRMASPGIKVVETSKDEKWLKKGQSRETPTKWRIREGSIVDIGGSDNAMIVALYNEDDELINLSEKGEVLPMPQLKADNTHENSNESTHQTINRMEKLITFFNLAQGATEDAVLERVQDLNGQVTNLTQENTLLKDQLKALQDAQKQQRKQEVIDLLDAAVKDGRIDATNKETWEKLFDKDHDSSKLALESMPKRQSAAQQLDQGKEKSLAEREKYVKLSWDELDKSGKLGTLKEKHYELYEEKFEEKFGNKPHK